MSNNPTREQQAAIEHLGNAVVTARPGSGKTFTLVRMIAREASDLLSYQGIIAISYTNKASDELEERCDSFGVNRASSFFGTIDKFCISEIISPFISHISGRSADFKIIENNDCSEWSQLAKLPLYDNDVRAFLRESLLAGSIPIGAIGPAALYILDTVPQARIYISSRYTSVFIDEYQDCGLCQHLIFKKLISCGLRGVVVGDIDQAIFRFADKSPDYLIELIRKEGFQHFKLTRNHRCDDSIQAYSLALLKIPSEPIDRLDRRVFAIHVQGDETALAKGIAANIDAIMKKYDVDCRSKVALIGAGNATLDLFSAKIGIPSKQYVNTPLDSGFSKWRHVFSGLLASYYDGAHFSGDFIDRYLSNESKRSVRNQGLELLDKFFSLSEDELANSSDLAISIARICEPDTEKEGDVEAYQNTIKDLHLLRGGFRPAQQNEINILSYHKAKGLEFDIVFCLETYQFIMPPYKYDEQLYDAYGQALAMHYVGLTRAKKACYIMLGSQRHNARGEIKDAYPSEFLNFPGLRELRIENQWE